MLLCFFEFSVVLFSSTESLSPRFRWKMERELWCETGNTMPDAGKASDRQLQGHTVLKY